MIERVDTHETMLTKWLEKNINDATTKSLTYDKFPTSWIWNRSIIQWTRWQAHRCIGQFPFAHASSTE